jgi:hypothetical protein
MIIHWMRASLFMLAGWTLLFPASVYAAGEGRLVAVDPTPPKQEQPGHPPYEIVRANRLQRGTPQVTFDDLRGWTMTVQGDADVSLTASVAQPIWRPQNARLHYADGTEDTTAVIRPPHPIEIKEPFDAARMWVFGGWYRHDAQSAPPPTLNVLLEDRNGRSVTIDLSNVISGNWSIQQGVLSLPERDPARFPMTFVGLKFGRLKIPKAQSDLFFDSLTFYHQQRDPVAHPLKIRNPIFPTSDDGMLPTSPKGIQTRVEADASGATLISQSAQGTLRFQIRPKEGALNGIKAQWNDGPWFQLADGGGLELDVSGKSRTIVDEATVVSQSQQGDAYHVQWRLNEPDASAPVFWEATYQIKGRTLVVDLTGKGGQAAAVNFGTLDGLKDAHGVFVPYLALGRDSGQIVSGPLVACGRNVFVSVLPDIYHSDFSDVTNTSGPAKEGSLRLFTSTNYQPLSNGRRNDLRERLLMSVSPEFADVLPNARNPASPDRKKLASYLYLMSYYIHPQFFSTLKRYGLDHVIAVHKNCAFVGIHADTLASFSYRWRPRPGISIEWWRKYGRHIHDLGYLFGMYTYFVDLFPTSEYWDENHVALNPSGSLRGGWWYGGFAVKMNDASAMAAQVCKLLKELYPVDFAYFDIGTVVGPSAYNMDFEAGVQGAGMARADMLANADLAAEIHKDIGPISSEGYHRWFYAGLSDIDYATLMYPKEHQSAAQVMPLIDFDLLKIHPFELGAMMGFDPQMFVSEARSQELLKDDGTGLAPIGFYQFVSASLAYGHMAALGYDYVPPLSRVIQLYALMQGVQTEYLVNQAKTIAYSDGERFYPTSEALRRKIVQEGRVRVEYDNGLIVQVNYNADKPWTVQAAGKSFKLPPYGWVIEKPGTILAYSALRDGHRVDVVQCPRYIYVNSNGKTFHDDDLGVEVEGAVWLKRLDSGAWRVIPCGDLGPWKKAPISDVPADMFDQILAGLPKNRGVGRLVLDTRQLLQRPADKVSIKARAEDDVTVEPMIHRLDDHRIEIDVSNKMLDYLME